MLGRRSEAQPLDSPPEKPRIQRYNKLGNTGLVVSDVIFGAGASFEPGVVRYSYDRGVTCFDTAATYGAGVSEETIGTGLAGVRDNCVIITKLEVSRRRPADNERFRRILENSLRKLRTDYVDGLFVHSMENMDPFDTDEVAESFARFKKEGKVRFTGFSTHNEKKTLSACVKPQYDGLVDAVMFRYNHMEGKSIEPLLEALHKKGIGTIAMKTLAGGKQGKLKELVDDSWSYPQAAVGWVLANKNIDCAVLSMESFEEIDSFTGASGRELDRSDHSLLERYRDAVDTTYCRATCDTCEAACPHDVAISDIMRYEMYFEDYGHEKRAMIEYASLPEKQKPVPCLDCSGYCTRVCPHHLPVRDRLLRAGHLLTVQSQT